jgi:monoamine oxidase
MIRTRGNSPVGDIQVAIIGAGLAGLYTAWLLEQAGVSCYVLEARERHGGRILSPRGINLGARYIGAFHHRVRRLAETFQIPLNPLIELPLEGPYQTPDPDFLLPSRLFFEGRWLSSEERTALVNELHALLAHLVDLAQPLIALSQAHGAPGPYPNSLLALDRLSVEAYLRQWGATPRLVACFTDLPPESQSMLGLLHLIAGGGGWDFFYHVQAYDCPGGMQALPDALLNALQGPVHFETALQTCKKLDDRQGYHLTALYHGNLRTFIADTVVFALPAKILSRIQGIPPVWQQALSWPLAQNRYITSVLPENSPVDEEDTALTDTALRWVSLLEGPSDTLLLDLLVRGGIAGHQAAATDLVAQALDLLAVTFPETITPLEMLWRDEPYSQGTYSYWPVGGASAILPLQQAQCYEGLVWVNDLFAPHWMGYMEGSLAGAERGVQTFLDKFCA